MGTAFLQLFDWGSRGHPHYFVLFFLFVVNRAVVLRLFARRYRPITERTRGVDPNYKPSFSVIVPVVDEKPQEFYEVLRAVVERAVLDSTGPMEIIVVINGRVNQALVDVCARFNGLVQVITRMEPGKRGAIYAGLDRTQGEIVILLDSDTRLRGNAIVELLRPFQFSWVGGVTTAQSIYKRGRSLLIRFADWMEDVRAGEGGSLRAVSGRGEVGCLPGRAIAFRRRSLELAREEFLGMKADGSPSRKGWFLGVRLKASDDRHFTNIVLKQRDPVTGRRYKTLFQSTSRVLTDAPSNFWTWVKQQIRWGRGSQYNTLRMIPFMIRHTPLLAFAYITEIIIPFWWLGTLVNAAWKIKIQGPQYYGVLSWYWQVGIVVGGVLVSAFLRNLPHFKRYPQDALPWYMVTYVLLLSFVLTPIRIYSFFVCATDASWGTRKGANEATRPTFNIRGTIPWLLGGGMLIFFSVAGPLLETPDLFLYQVHKHQDLVIFGPIAVYVAALIVRFIRWRNPPWLTEVATFLRLIARITVIAGILMGLLWLAHVPRPQDLTILSLVSGFVAGLIERLIRRRNPDRTGQVSTFLRSIIRAAMLIGALLGFLWLAHQSGHLLNLNVPNLR